MSNEIIRNHNNADLSDEEILNLINLRENEPVPEHIQKMIEASERSGGKCQIKFVDICSEQLLKNFIVHNPIDENIITLCCQNCYNWALENKEEVFSMGYSIIIGTFELG